MKNIRDFGQFVNDSEKLTEGSLAKPKKFKKKTGPLTIQVDANDVEIDASAVWGQFAEGPMYIYPNDEGWDNMLDADTDKAAKANLKLLMSALKKCLNAKGDIIADDKAIKNLDTVMDNLDDMGWENSGGHFFGGEMYNGWQYDDHGSGNVTDAMISSALYAYAKIESFLWWKSLNESEITESVFGNATPKSKELALLLDQAINKVDDSLSYKDLAIAIALILEDNYGTHNYKPFLKELEKQLK